MDRGKRDFPRVVGMWDLAEFLLRDLKVIHSVRVQRGETEEVEGLVRNNNEGVFHDVGFHFVWKKG